MSFATSKEGLPLSFAVAPGNMHDSKLYVTTVQGIKIRQSSRKSLNKPKIMNAEAVYDSREIRKYNRKKGYKIQHIGKQEEQEEREKEGQTLQDEKRRIQVQKKR